MKKFKNKATGVIYTVTADAIIAQFERDSRYVEVKVKGASTKGKAEEVKADENAPADENQTDASNNDETNDENK